MQVDATRLETVKVDPLYIVERRLEHDLKLVMFEQAVRILTEATVGRAPRRLHVGDVPMGRSEYT